MFSTGYGVFQRPLCYDAPMTRALAVVLAMVLGSSGLLASREDLARARRSSTSAASTRRSWRPPPAAQDPGHRRSPRAIVLARAHLERYRQARRPDRPRRRPLGAGRPSASTGSAPPTAAEFLIALGGSLFLEDDFGAAAEIFESAMEIAPAAGDEGSRVGARLVRLGHGALGRALRDLAAERADAVPSARHAWMPSSHANPGSRAAAYWLVVALRGEGQLERAWQAAIAGWARARLAGEAAGDLRADLDRLVRQGIIPDRTRDIPDADRLTVEFAMRAEWELVKQKWR